MQRAELEPGELRRAGGSVVLGGWQEGTTPSFEIVSVLEDWHPRVVQQRLGYCGSRCAFQG